jgi:hypothetical protein
VIRNNQPFVGQRPGVSSNTSRFHQYKQKHQTIAIPLSIIRFGLKATGLDWYTKLRAIGDWSTGILPPHATPEWLEKTFGVSRRQRLTRERELRRAGLFESVQVMDERTIKGRKRWVKVERTARIFAEPQTSQNTNNNAGVSSVPFLSRLKSGTPNSLKILNSQALPSSQVNPKFKSTSLPLDRVAPRSPEPAAQRAKPPEASRSGLPDLTKDQSNPNPSRKEKEPLYRPDLALRSVLDIRENYFLKDDDVRGWVNIEERWRRAGAPVDRTLLVKFLEDAITSMTRDGVLYHPVALLRLKQLRRHEFSPRISAPSSASLKFTPEPGACPRCGGFGLVQRNGVGNFCDCTAGKRLMFPHAEREGVAHELRNAGA